MSQDVQQWMRDLKAAGWVEAYSNVYRAPCGCMYRGPYRAWTVLCAMNAAQQPCPNDHRITAPMRVE